MSLNSPAELRRPIKCLMSNLLVAQNVLGLLVESGFLSNCNRTLGRASRSCTLVKYPSQEPLLTRPCSALPPTRCSRSCATPPNDPILAKCHFLDGAPLSPERTGSATDVGPRGSCRRRLDAQPSICAFCLMTNVAPIYLSMPPNSSPQDVCRRRSNGLRLGRLLALQKPNGGIRALVIGDVFRRLVSRTLAQQASDAFMDVCSPFHQVVRK